MRQRLWAAVYAAAVLSVGDRLLALVRGEASANGDFGAVDWGWWFLLVSVHWYGYWAFSTDFGKWVMELVCTRETTTARGMSALQALARSLNYLVVPAAAICFWILGYGRAPVGYVLMAYAALSFVSLLVTRRTLPEHLARTRTGQVQPLTAAIGS